MDKVEEETQGDGDGGIREVQDMRDYENGISINDGIIYAVW